MHRIAAQWTIVNDMPSPYPNFVIRGETQASVEVGTGTANANKAAVLRTTLAGSGTVDIDFRALSTPDGTIALDKLVGLMGKILTPGGKLTLTPGASNGFDGFGSACSLKCSAEGVLVWVYPAGATVDSTHKVLTATNVGATSIEIELHVLGLDS